jgi:hypothetical protein
MRHALLTAALTLTLGAWLAPAATAQNIKPGKPYEETTELGFKVGVPDDWVLIPPDPNEGNTIAKFDPKGPNNFVVVNVSTHPEELGLHVWIARFETNPPKKEKEPGGKVELKQRSKDVESFVKREVLGGMSDFKELSKKELEINKIPATEYLFSSMIGAEEIRAYAVVYKFKPETSVAWIGLGLGGKKWTRYEGPYREMAKSFKAADVKENAALKPQGDTYRDKRRAELMTDVAKTNGAWKLYETPRYFIITDYDKKAFLDDVKMRLEAIRDIYEKDYPYEKMQEIKAAAAKAHTGEKREADPEKEAGKALAKAVLGDVDPREASKASVVRVCKNEGEYMSYGGPQGSAGYWNFVAKELVLYDDSNNGGKSTGRAVLNHEAFHQYIFYLYGNLAPHSWYNEGTGDFYSGFQMKSNKQFELDKFAWRKDEIAQAIQQNHYVPLKEIVHWSQKDYYSPNAKYGSNPYIHYAEGWSLIYFLRTGKKAHAKGWNDAWDKILDTYFTELGATEDLEQSVNKAFEGVDWDAFEQAWKDYTK